MAEKRSYRRRRNPDGGEDEFYEAMPATMDPVRYRDEPVIIEHDRDDRDSRTGVWALAALIIVGLLLLLLIIGRLGSTNFSSPNNNSLPNQSTTR